MSTFCTSAGTSVHFHQLFVHLLDTPLTSINFPCFQGNFCQLFVHQQDLPSSTVNIPCIRWTLRQHHQLSTPPLEILSTICAFVGPSDNFRQLSLSPCDLPSNFCVSKGSYEFSMHPQDIPSTSDNILCIRGTFC